MSYLQNPHQQRLMELSFTLVFWLSLAIVGRLLPHPPNITPLTSLSLMSGVLLTKRLALLLTLMTLYCSDILIGLIYHYPFFGSWTLFTYSGFAAIALLGSPLSVRASLTQFLIMTGSASFAYWLWTNAGVWLMSGMYPHSTAGLLTCYAAAIPFLRNAICGDLLWMAMLFSVLREVQHHRMFSMILNSH